MPDAFEGVAYADRDKPAPGQNLINLRPQGMLINVTNGEMNLDSQLLKSAEFKNWGYRRTKGGAETPCPTANRIYRIQWKNADS